MTLPRERFSVLDYLATAAFVFFVLLCIDILYKYRKAVVGLFYLLGLK